MTTEKSVDDIEEEIGAHPYVSPKKSDADLNACKKLWAEVVHRTLGDGYKGEIRDYDLEPEPMNTGDMRDTWMMCIVKGGKVISADAFLPWAEDDDGLYHELAEEVVRGALTIAQAKKSAQYHAEHKAEEDLQYWIDAGRYSPHEMLVENKVRGGVD